MRRQCAPSVTLAVLACLSAACGKSAPAPAAETARPVLVPQANGDAIAVQDAEGAARLARVWHEVRCTLVGAAIADENLYSRHAFAGPRAFGDAFSAQAKANPAWARQVVADSYQRGCQGDKPVAAPPAVTPTAPVAAEPSP